jgi:hypothetical protein
VLEELVPAACHLTEHYANNAIEADHGRLKSRLRPMRGLKQLRCAQVISAGHAFIQNIRRGHYELGTEEVINLRVLAAFDELALRSNQPKLRSRLPRLRPTQQSRSPWRLHPGMADRACSLDRRSGVYDRDPPLVGSGGLARGPRRHLILTDGHEHRPRSTAPLTGWTESALVASELSGDPVPGTAQWGLQRALHRVTPVSMPAGLVTQIMKIVTINRQQHSALAQFSYLVRIGEQMAPR